MNGGVVDYPALLVAFLALLLPGMHVNTLAPLLPSEEYILIFGGAYLVMSIIQAMFFAVSPPAEVSALPYILRLMATGEKKRLFLAHVIGAAFGILFSSVLYFPGSYALAYSFVKPYLKYVLLFAVVLLLMKNNRRAYWVSFFLAGVLGWLGFKVLKDAAFLPMFTGFFALSNLLTKPASVQRVDENSLTLPSSQAILSASFLGSLLGFVALLLPGISSPSVVSALFLPFYPSPLPYIALTSSIVASQYTYALHTWKGMGKSRVGWIKHLPRDFDSSLFYAGFLFSSILAFLLLSTAKFHISRRFKYVTALFLLLIVYALGGLPSLLFMLPAFFIGKIADDKTSLLSSIILPTLLILWGIYV